MNIYKALVIFSFFIFCGNSTYAKDDYLLKHCINSDIYNINTGKFKNDYLSGVCYGFISGAATTMLTLNNELPSKFKVCTPPNMTNQQLVSSILKHLKRVPDKLHENRINLILGVFLAEYRCK